MPASRPMVDGLPISRTKAGVNRPVDVYLQSLSGSGTKLQVSTLGGSAPRWRRDGKELYYLAPDRMLMVVSVNLDGNQPRIDVPSPLFQTRVGRFLIPAVRRVARRSLSCEQPG